MQCAQLAEYMFCKFLILGFIITGEIKKDYDGLWAVFLNDLVVNSVECLFVSS